MDSLIGIKGKDFVILAADTTNAYSVLRMKVSLASLRTTMIKFGTSMVKKSCLSEVRALIFWYSEIMSRRTLPTSGIKMVISCPLKTLLSL